MCVSGAAALRLQARRKVAEHGPGPDRCGVCGRTVCRHGAVSMSTHVMSPGGARPVSVIRQVGPRWGRPRGRDTRGVNDPPPCACYRIHYIAHVVLVPIGPNRTACEIERICYSRIPIRCNLVRRLQDRPIWVEMKPGSRTNGAKIGEGRLDSRHATGQEVNNLWQPWLL